MLEFSRLNHKEAYPATHLGRSSPMQSVIPRLMLAQVGSGRPQSQHRSLPGIRRTWCSTLARRGVAGAGGGGSSPPPPPPTG